jgi:hypothetical protein
MKTNRRHFLGRAAWGGAGLLLLKGAGSVWSAQANEKLNVALVGVGGRGSWFVGAIPRLGENLVALCDVDDAKNPDAYKQLPRARKFGDFRRMLETTQLDLPFAAGGSVSGSPDGLAGEGGSLARAGAGLVAGLPRRNTRLGELRLCRCAERVSHARQRDHPGRARHATRLRPNGDEDRESCGRRRAVAMRLSFRMDSVRRAMNREGLRRLGLGDWECKKLGCLLLSFGPGIGLWL